MTDRERKGQGRMGRAGRGGMCQGAPVRSSTDRQGRLKAAGLAQEGRWESKLEQEGGARRTRKAG